MVIFEMWFGDGHGGKRPACEYVERYIGLPGINCKGEPGCCGEIWSDSIARIPIEPPIGACRSDVFGGVSPSTLRKAQDELRRALGLTGSVPLPPGTDAGLLHLRCERADTLAVEWPALHGFVVRDDFLQAIKRHDLTGWYAADVVVESSPVGEPRPKLNEIIVTGTGGIALTEPPIRQLTECPVCGRRTFEKAAYTSLALDEARWDGSDIFRFDEPLSGYIFVTERWVNALGGYQFDGANYYTVDEMLKRRASV